MTTNVVSIVSFTGPRAVRYGLCAGSPQGAVVPFTSPEVRAAKLLARWIAERALSEANAETLRTAERREADARRRFNVAKHGGAHPMLVDKLLNAYWAAKEDRHAVVLSTSRVATVGTAVALDAALGTVPEEIGKRLVADLTPMQAGRIGRIASALRRRRPRVQVTA